MDADIDWGLRIEGGVDSLVDTPAVDTCPDFRFGGYLAVGEPLCCVVYNAAA